MIAGLLTRLLQLDEAWLRRLSGGSLELDGQLLDAQSQAVLGLISLTGSKPPYLRSVAAARADMDGLVRLAPKRPELLQVRDELADHAIPVRVYRPYDLPQPAPAVIYYHGGGWVLGGLDSHDALCAELAVEAGCLVVSAGYRLAPEHPFPAAVDDALAAFRWTVAQADRLGVDRRRVAVAGDSAGGNLAAVVAQQLRGSAPCFQLLIYPVTDATRETRSYRLFSEGLFLERLTMRWFFHHYLPDSGSRADPRASPLLATDLSGLPPAYIVLAGFDPLRDEGLRYAERLREAQVSVEVALFPTTIHGFISLKDLIRVGREGFERCARALRAAFTSRPASPAAGTRKTSHAK